MPISATAIRSRIICSVQPDSSRVSPIEHADFSTDWTNSNDSSYRFALFLSGGVGEAAKSSVPCHGRRGVCTRVRACVCKFGSVNEGLTGSFANLNPAIVAAAAWNW